MYLIRTYLERTRLQSFVDMCVLDADSVMIRKAMLAVAVAVCSGQTMVASPGSETDLQIRLLATCMQSSSPRRELVLSWEMMEFCSDTLVDWVLCTWSKCGN